MQIIKQGQYCWYLEFFIIFGDVVDCKERFAEESGKINKLYNFFFNNTDQIVKDF